MDHDPVSPVDEAPGLMDRLGLGAIALLAATLIRLLRATMRIQHSGREPATGLEGAGRRYILAFWHGRLLMMPYSYRGRGLAALISRHRDGEYIARTMSWFGHPAIRGSSTRGGTAALKAAVRALRDEWDVAFTPDGPKGPAYRVQGGVIQAARLSGAPIVPVTFSARPASRLSSWDGFLVPWPFSRGTFLYGEPLEVPRDADSGRMEELRAELESRLRRLTEKADGEPLPEDLPVAGQEAGEGAGPV